MIRSPRRGASTTMPNNTQSNQLLTLGDVASETQVSRRTVQRAIERGRLKCVRIGRQIRIRPEEVDRWWSESSQ